MPPSPVLLGGMNLEQVLLDIGVPVLTSIACSVMLVTLFCCRRWRRRRRIALLWQQHIQDTSGTMGDSFLDVPAAGAGING